MKTKANPTTRRREPDQTRSLRRHAWLQSGVAIVIAFFWSNRICQAQLKLTIQHVGADVVLSIDAGSSLSTQGLYQMIPTGVANGWVYPQNGELSGAAVGRLLSGASTWRPAYGEMIAPANFGVGSYTEATSSSIGNSNVFLVSDGYLLLPEGYVSNTPIPPGEMTFADTDFATLGITPGQYIWTWPNARTGRGGFGKIVLNAIPKPATIVGRHVFYNHSAWDNNDLAANADDDNAIATDKNALLSGQVATFDNYTSYSRGINGIMIDVADLAGTPTASDFDFKIGNNHDPAGWADAPAPASITVRDDEGASGSDRVTIIWENNAIQKCWLQVTVKATPNTGLSADDVHCWGNAIGETGNSTVNAAVNGWDEAGVRANNRTSSNPGPITDVYDINRDTFVNGWDEAAVRAFNTTSSTMLVLLDLTDPSGALQSVTRTSVMMQTARARVARSEGNGTISDAALDLNVAENTVPESAKNIDIPMTMHRTDGGAIVMEFTVPEGTVLQSTSDLKAWRTVDIDREDGIWRESKDRVLIKAAEESRFFRVIH